jgi:hypothetical protein
MFISVFKYEVLSFKLSLAALIRASNASSSSFVLIGREGVRLGGGISALLFDCSAVDLSKEDRMLGGEVCDVDCKDPERCLLTPRKPLDSSAR